MSEKKDEPAKSHEQPQSSSLLGDPEAGGRAGQGGMTADDDNQVTDEGSDQGLSKG